MMAKKITDEGIAENYEEYLDSLLREEISATAVGYDVGLPHGKSTTVKRAAVAFARLKNPVLWMKRKMNMQKWYLCLLFQMEKKELHI